MSTIKEKLAEKRLEGANPTVLAQESVKALEEIQAEGLAAVAELIEETQLAEEETAKLEEERAAELAVDGCFKVVKRTMILRTNGTKLEIKDGYIVPECQADYDLCKEYEAIGVLEQVKKEK